jgi:hypothetical protein
MESGLAARKLASSEFYGVAWLIRSDRASENQTDLPQTLQRDALSGIAV